MGNMWEVYAYTNTSKSKNEFRYEYVPTWCGQSLVKMYLRCNQGQALIRLRQDRVALIASQE